MNKLLIWLFGAMVGAGAAYIFCKEKIKKELEASNTELLDAIQESMEERYRQKYEKKDEKKEEEVESRPDTHPKSSIVKPNPEDRERVLYEKASKIIVENGYDPADKEFPTEEPPKHEKRTGGPYIVTEEEVYDADCGYDCKVLHYDPENVIVTDDFGYELEDVDQEVGWDNLHILRDQYADEGVIYIRNDGLELDYEVYLGIV